MLVDRGVAQSDGQAILPQDALDVTRTISVPSSIPRNISQQIHWFRSTYDTQIATSATVPTYGAVNFVLSYIGDYTGYQSIFDEYCIVEATVRFVPIQGPGAVAAPLTGEFITVLDHDDSTPLSTLSSARDYPSALITKGSVGQTRVCYPRLATALYAGAFTSYGQTKCWIDMASPQVVHYGIKWAADSSSSSILYNVTQTLVFCCRSSR